MDTNATQAEVCSSDGLGGVAPERDFNVEFNEPGEGWSAQYTGVSQPEAEEKAKLLRRSFLNDSKQWPIRITKGLPFGNVVADFNRRGALRWMDWRMRVALECRKAEARREPPNDGIEARR